MASSLRDATFGADATRQLNNKEISVIGFAH
jgi:hypothetical protein